MRDPIGRITEYPPIGGLKSILCLQSSDHNYWPTDGSCSFQNAAHIQSGELGGESPYKGQLFRE
jgi:hypothetical protein